jgi:hypothetical protein
LHSIYGLDLRRSTRLVIVAFSFRLTADDRVCGAECRQLPVAVVTVC